MTTREQLLGSFTRRYIEFDVRGMKLRARNLNEGEKAAFEAGTVTDDGKVNLKAIASQRRRLIQLCLVDDQDHLLLNTPGDIDRLRELDAAVTTAIFEVVRSHCGFDADEGATKKKLAAAGDDSPTD